MSATTIKMTAVADKKKKGADMIRRIIESIKGLIITSTKVPMLTCSKCGKQYRYRNVKDFDVSICPDCQCSFKGGAYDGMTVGDLYDKN